MAINLGGVLAGFSQAVSDKIVKEDEARRELETYEKKTEIQSAASQRTAAANRAYQDKKQAKEMAGLINYYFTDPKLNKAMSNMSYSYQAEAIKEAENLAKEGYSLQSFMTLGDGVEGGRELANNILIDRPEIQFKKSENKEFNSWEEANIFWTQAADRYAAKGDTDRAEKSMEKATLFLQRAVANKIITPDTGQREAINLVDNSIKNVKISLGATVSDMGAVIGLPESANEGLNDVAGVSGSHNIHKIANLFDDAGELIQENIAENKFIYQAARSAFESSAANLERISNTRFKRFKLDQNGAAMWNGTADTNPDTAETSIEGFKFLAMQEGFFKGWNEIGNYGGALNPGDTMYIKVGEELKMAVYTASPNPLEGGAPFLPLN